MPLRFLALYSIFLCSLLGSTVCPLYADGSIQQLGADTGLPNISARPQLRKNNVDLFADFLYWRATETADWALVLLNSPGEEKVTYKTLLFDWEPAFRVGIGYHMGHDRWDTQFSYTRFETHASEHVKEGPGVINSAFLGAKAWGTGPYKTAHVKMSIDFNLFDWDLGRSFLVSQALSLRPSIGLKGGWIDQSIRSSWRNPNFDDFGSTIILSATEDLENDFYGGGPKSGCDLKWIFGKVHESFFSFFGTFSAAFLWGHWSIRDEFRSNLYFDAKTREADKNFGAVALQALMGVGWETNFRRNRSHFAVKLGYEIQDWFNQYLIFDDSTGAQSNDLVLQGLTLDVRLDF